MRESLKSFTSNQVILEDNTTFCYIIKPFELKNPMGNVVAVLKEYIFTNKGDIDGTCTFKLYKTKEENWYDLEENNSAPEKILSLMLKGSINEKEKNNSDLVISRLRSAADGQG
jgi:hypothetical protein